MKEGARGKEESTREASAARHAACCALRGGLARVFVLRALARGASLAAARADARERARRARGGAQCA